MKRRNEDDVDDKVEWSLLYPALACLFPIFAFHVLFVNTFEYVIFISCLYFLFDILVQTIGLLLSFLVKQAIDQRWEIFWRNLYTNAEHDVNYLED